MSEINGWIKLHRELINKPIWVNSTLEQRVILITLLCMANHSAKKWEWQGKPYYLQPGQFISSIPGIVNICNSKEITAQKVRTALERFEKLEFLTDKSTNKNRLVTILNWELYQSCIIDDNSQNNSHLTGSQQALNRQITANKNVKNDNNINNIYRVGDKPQPSKEQMGAPRQQDVESPSKEQMGAPRQQEVGNLNFIIPTIEEIQAYCSQRKNTVDVARFYDYYTSNGWKVGKNKMRDWKATVRRWEATETTGVVNKNVHTSKFNNYSSPKYKQADFEEVLRRKAEGNKL